VSGDWNSRVPSPGAVLKVTTRLISWLFPPSNCNSLHRFFSLLDFRGIYYTSNGAATTVLSTVQKAFLVRPEEHICVWLRILSTWVWIIQHCTVEKQPAEPSIKIREQIDCFFFSFPKTNTSQVGEPFELDRRHPAPSPC
jgi:hypothetical protein